MSALTNRRTPSRKPLQTGDSLVDSVRVLSDMTKKDIEKSYNINDAQGTEAYYSNRYGWTLRTTIA